MQSSTKRMARSGSSRSTAPTTANSMTPEILDGFAIAATRAATDETLRALIVTGTGKCFSAGADFKSQIQREDAGSKLAPHEKSYAMYEPFLTLLDVKIPVIGALNGHAVGGGFGLSLVCDIRIAATEAKYGANFTKLGLAPGMAITYLLPRLVGVSRAAEMLFTGELFEGKDAVALGYASRAVPGADVLAEALRLAERIAASAPLAVRYTKQVLYQGMEWDPRSHAKKEAVLQAKTVASADAKEGIQALLEKRVPRFTGE
jgi:enoyl-CoA hydratase